MPGQLWEDDSDHDDPQPEDMDDEGTEAEEELLICPSCRESVHEDTEKCPHCGDWITPVDSRAGGWRWIWTVAAGLLIAAMLLASLL